MRVVHEDSSHSSKRAELRSDYDFKVKVWWTNELIASRDMGGYFNFDIDQPCWAWHLGSENGVYIVELVAAVDEDVLLGTAPFAGARPVLKGVSWLVFDDLGEDT